MTTTTVLPEPEVRDLSESLYEVVDGEIVEKPAIGAYENSLAMVLGMRIANFVDSLRIGRAWFEMLFDFRPMLIQQRRPDVSYVSAERWPFDRPVPRTSAWRLVPDLAIEIISPTNPAGDMDAKIDEYFTVGVSHVWVVYPQTRRIYLYETPSSIRIIQRGEVLTDESLLPGFRLDLDELFGPTD